MSQFNQGEATESLDLLDLLPHPYRSITERFLLNHWVELATLCYAHYLSEGRGVMLLAVTGTQFESHYLSWMQLQAHWHDLLADADRSIQTSLQQLVPTYNPDKECVFLFEFPNDELMSVVMRVTRAALSTVQQRPGVAVPKTHRWEFVTPKAAYQLSHSRRRSP
jgi:hypothetical protein